MPKADAALPNAARGNRPRGQRVEVWLTADEKRELGDRAALAGLSVSAFVRTAGLNHPVSARADTEVAEKLVGVAADLGRLGGLLKLWLAERRNQGAPARKVAQTLDDIRRLQQQIACLAGRVLPP